jgi:flagellar export protein FliJ
MKRFQFPLRSVSLLRAHREMVARESLASSMRACACAEERLGAVLGRMAEMERMRSAGRETRFKPSDEVAFIMAYRREIAAAAEARRLLTAAIAEVEARRKACVEANRQVKVVSRLEAFALANHRLGVSRAEQAEFDEVAGRRAARRRHSLT